MAFTSKDSLIKALKEQLATNEKRAIEGLLRIYSFQTNEEKCKGYTKEFNGMGFSSIDSDVLSSFAEQYITEGWLSPKQIICVKKNMPKYASQLINLLIANGKIVKEKGEYIFVR